MGPKRASDDNLAPVAKVPKLEPGLAGASLLPQHAQLGSPQSDFSGSVKKKLASSSRTGQACDRCKVCRAPLSRGALECCSIRQRPTAIPGHCVGQSRHMHECIFVEVELLQHLRFPLSMQTSTSNTTDTTATDPADAC